MVQYPNYLNYQNPAQMYNMQMPNPYLDRLQNLQQFQQGLQAQPGITARVVNDFSTLTANDVPMNGGAFFVKADGSEIEQREWSANGQIVTKRYKAILDNLETDPNTLLNGEEKSNYDTFKSFVGAFESKIDLLNDKLDEVLKQKPVSKAKKEVVADE